MVSLLKTDVNEVSAPEINDFPAVIAGAVAASPCLVLLILLGVEFQRFVASFNGFFDVYQNFGAKNNLVVVAKGFYIFLERLLWDLSGFGARFAEFSCIFNIYNMISGRELPVV